MSEPGRRWDIGGPAPKAVREAEYPIERAVSKYIGAALQVAGRPPPVARRADQGRISLTTAPIEASEGRE